MIDFHIFGTHLCDSSEQCVDCGVVRHHTLCQCHTIYSLQSDKRNQCHEFQVIFHQFQWLVNQKCSLCAVINTI